MVNYADDNTIYASEKYVEALLKTVGKETSVDDKSHLILANREHDSGALGAGGGRREGGCIQRNVP